MITLPLPMPVGGRLTLLGVVLVGFVIVGCGRDDPALVPGNVPSGPIEEVAGYGGAGGMRDAERIAREIGVVPITARAPKTIPVIRPPEVISFYVFPRKSGDGQSYRHGFYIDSVIKPFSWGMDEIRQNDRLRLQSLLNLRIDDEGQLIIDEMADQGPDRRTVQGIRSMAATIPWRAGSETEEETTTTIIYEDGRGAVSTRQPAPTAPTYLGPQGSVNLAEVERAIRDADRRIREAQRSAPPDSSPIDQPALDGFGASSPLPVAP